MYSQGDGCDDDERNDDHDDENVDCDEHSGMLL